jgi:riboflavin transporter FmnP
MVLDSILQFFQSIFNTLPKSVKYLIALAIVLGFLFLIPLFTHLLGYHCDSEKNVRRVSIFNIDKNFQLSQLSREDVYNTSDFKPIVTANFILTNRYSCSKLIRFDHSSFAGDFYRSCTDSNTTDCVWALSINNFKGWFSDKPKCLDCTDQRDISFITTTREFDGQYCFSDAYPNNQSDCPNLELCDIPYGYMFSNDTGKFYCIADNVCGMNRTQVIYDVDILLNSVNAKKVYATTQGLSYDKAMQIKCDSDLQPQISIYGIPVFNPVIWVLLYAVAAMFFFLNKIKSH